MEIWALGATPPGDIGLLQWEPLCCQRRGSSALSGSGRGLSSLLHQNCLLLLLLLHQSCLLCTRQAVARPPKTPGLDLLVVGIIFGIALRRAA